MVRSTLQLTSALMQKGDFEAAEKAFRDAISKDPFDHALLLNYAVMKRLADERDEAILILDHCSTVFGDDEAIQNVRARIELERGGDAVPLYGNLAKRDPTDQQHQLGLASALAAAGRYEDAIATLHDAVKRHPTWIESQTTLAKLRWEAGDQMEFDRNFFDAISNDPSNLELRFAHCGLLASGQHYDRLNAAIVRGRKAAGPNKLFDMFEAQAESEAGNPSQAEKLFQAVGEIDDYSFAAVRIRHLLKTGRPREAAMLGQKFIARPGANFIWPLIGLAWRQYDQARWQWLEQSDATVKSIDLQLPQGLLTSLTALLTKLHNARMSPVDLSVRGGTQTRLNLLDRSEPEIASLRKAIRSAVQSYINGLPPVDHGHPFLSAPRQRFHFAGSWSICLKAAGQHISHVHPAGWISSALYVAVPATLNNQCREGWLAIGGAPEELGLDLPPTSYVEPKPGRLVLFPSVAWHGTEAFERGMRLSVAFDVVPFAA
jgi:tetratricopeptide (TPR) repeat protein